MARLALVIAVLLAFTTGATAGDKVDWSKYIDPNPSAPVKSAPVVAASDDPPPKASKAKATKASKKKAAPKRKAKARAKAKARR